MITSRNSGLNTNFLDSFWKNIRKMEEEKEENMSGNVHIFYCTDSCNTLQELGVGNIFRGRN